ncbi:MAG: radical SAM protein, partial [Deltaproteobacteria bacterium]|nr:radical SAM protein [Deltaproteobacteria bacterium]
MYYLVYLTDKCNLFCRYCDSAGHRILYGHEITYDFERLIDFLHRDGDVSLKLYGGEPLLRIDLIEELLARVRCRHVALQTNGTLLDRLPLDLANRLDVISLSLDGPADVTDFKRGRGVYRQVIRQARALRRRGYRGPFDIRMTISPGVDIERSVRHFCAGRDLEVANVHWQMTALFRSDEWGGLRAARVRDWFATCYNPGITALVRWWIGELAAGRYHRVVPFACLAHDLVTGDRVDNVRCGAGHLM